MNKRINILLVDDHEMFAEGIQSMFSNSELIHVAAVTNNGNTVPSIIKSNEIDVILMDISMPILDGILTMQLLKDHKIEIPILMLTMHDSFPRIKKALNKGAKGYIIKNATSIELEAAITAISKGENYFHPKISSQIFDYFKEERKPVQEALISEREKEIVAYVAQGLNSKHIAEKLFLSEHTIKAHRRNIMHKCAVKNTAELIQLAAKKEWV